MEGRALKQRLEEQFGGRALVTVATGITSSHLGDERNLREYLAASEAVRLLREIGCNVFFLLIDDSLDPLNDRQLRVAVRKDPEMIERWRPWCGAPISHIPDPFGCHPTYSRHFQEAILQRFHGLEVYPQVIDSALSYQRGLYDPYIRTVFERYEEIIRFLETEFEGYHLQRLFWILCPACGFLDGVDLLQIRDGLAAFRCGRCGHEDERPFGDLKGKLSWKLDCAARWNIFQIDIEPFSKAYLDPKVGTYYVAKALSERFFGGKSAWPLRYGHVTLAPEMSYRLLTTLPGGLIRQLFLNNLESDITINRDRVLQTARNYPINDRLSFYHYVTQLLPLRTAECWATLTEEDASLVPKGLHFAAVMLDRHYAGYWPKREVLESFPSSALLEVSGLIQEALQARERLEDDSEAFRQEMHDSIARLGERKREITAAIRQILNHEAGLPLARLLYIVPPSLLKTIHTMLSLILDRRQAHLLETPPDVGDWDDSQTPSWADL